jgi:hypothetical protein
MPSLSFSAKTLMLQACMLLGSFIPFGFNSAQ